MEPDRYRCLSAERRRLVRDSGTHNGIDFLEVAPDQTELLVRFLADLPGTGAAAVPPAPAPALTAANLQLTGGSRITGLAVTAVVTAGSQLRVRVDRPGDFSPYTLSLVRSPVDPEPPAGFDPRLSAVTFGFKVGCPTPADCAEEPARPPATRVPPVIDYLARDYESLRRLLLDRIATLVPGWNREHPADPAVALVEALAHVGDQLSYFQDAVATEAYLATARQRISVRRHARLLDHRLHEGSNARTWLVLEVDERVTLPAHTPVLSGPPPVGARPAVPARDLARLLAAEQPVVFETTAPAELRPEAGGLALYTWGDSECCLEAGACSATLVTPLDPDDAPVLGLLAPGRVLLFEERIGPTTGLPADADRSHRHAVRLVEAVDTDGGAPLIDPVTGTAIIRIAWDPADALPFPLCVSSRFVAPDGTETVAPVAVARGNVVACDHGRTVEGLALEPPAPPGAGPWRPTVDTTALTWASPLPDTGPASLALAHDPARLDPVLSLVDDQRERWEALPDLLGSDSMDAVFTVETDDGGVPHLRFGDGQHGRVPAAGAGFTATARIGSGAAGNVGAEVLQRIVFDGTGIRAVRNPLPATGGSDPEPVARTRVLAPQAFRLQERAVTADDYAEVARRHPQVQQAVAELRWTGSWHTVFVTVDRLGGLAVDDAFAADLTAFLENYRLAGRDVEIRSPRFVGIDLALVVGLGPDAVRSEVRRQISDRLSNRVAPDGTRGLFHPDRFAFGTPAYLSQVYEAVAAVPGVVSAQASRFQRSGLQAAGELDDGVIRPSGSEILRLDNDPNFPERGTVALDLRGGR